ncbi:unnamed protein product [Alternaria alternata]
MAVGKHGSKDTAIQILWDASKMQIGSGYVAHEGQAVASPFLPFTLAEPSTTDPDVVYEHIIISNEEEFQQEISSSMKAKASIFGVGLEASFEQLRDIKYNAKSITSHKSSSTLSAIITYTGSSRKQIDELKGGLSVGKGFASIEGAAAYKERAETSNLQHTIKWQTSGLALSLLTMNPSPEDIQRVLKDYASCKPKPQIALLEHYSLIENRISRMGESGGSSHAEEIAEARLEAQKIQTRSQSCCLLGANDVKSQVAEVNRALAALPTSSKAWKETLAEHCGRLWRLRKRLDLMFEGEQLIKGASLSSRKEWFR